MCLVNCAKTMDFITEAAAAAATISAEQEIKSELRGECQESRKMSSRDALAAEDDGAAITPDAMTIATQWTRRSFQKINRQWKKMQRTTSLRILTKTSQPAHVVAVILTGLVMYAMYPSTTPSLTTNSCEASPQNVESDDASPSTNKFALFGYLSTFAIQFGSQIWMTFVSGLALYFSLPRHTFGQCQRVLFPKYFLMNACLGLLKLYCFCKMLDGKERIGTAAFAQIVLIGTATLVEAGIYLHLVEPLLDLMCLKHKYEMMVGSGQEVGFENLKALKESAVYKQVHKGFRRTHSSIAMGNLVTVACSFSHLVFMIQKIQFA